MANTATGAGAYIQGSDVLVFMGGKALAYATNSSISLSADSTDVSHKDYGSGWNNSVITSRSWEMTTDALYAEDVLSGAGGTFETLFDAYINGTEVEVVFGATTNAGATTRNPNVPAEGWTFSSHTSYKGKARVTSLSVSAGVGDNATYSVTFTGLGPVEKVSAGS